MVGTALAIEREIEDTQSIRAMDTSGKRKGDQTSSSLGKRQRTSVSRAPRYRARQGR